MCDEDMEELRDHTVTRDEPKLASDVGVFLVDLSVESCILRGLLFLQPSARYILRCRN